MSYSFNITYLDTDAISFTKPDMSPFSKDEQHALVAEINALLPEHIKFSHDGYMPALVVLKTKNRFYLTEDKKIKIKGSSLRSSKIEPAIAKYHKRCVDALLGLTDEKVPGIYLEECRKLATLETVEDWASRKALSEKTFNSTRKNEKSLRDAVSGSGAVVGDRVQVYFDVNNNLKLVEKYDPQNPDHNLPRLLKKLYTSSKLFDTVLPDFKDRVNYGLSTKARAYNDLLRIRLMPEKVKKPSVKNSLQELMDLITKEKMHASDAYGNERLYEAMAVAQTLLTPKPKTAKDPNTSKKTRKKKEKEPTDELF